MKKEANLFYKLAKCLTSTSNMYSEWMENQSDTIQAAAKCYGDRLMSDQFFV